MKKLEAFLCAAVLAGICASGTALADATASPSSTARTLVYSFTFNVQQSGEVTNDPGTSGAHDYSGNLNDSGTMTVNVQREQQDRGLILTISEHGLYGRNAGAATCVVYGNTNIICDPNATVNTEEYTLLRFLGPTFIDPAQIDEKQHWKIETSDPTIDLLANYRIESNANGVMQISETRNVTHREAGERRSNVQTKIVYDFNKLVPTSVDEYNIERQYGGSEATGTSTFQTTLKLVSDSMAKP
jgi:hypothetical protein